MFKRNEFLRVYFICSYTPSKVTSIHQGHKVNNIVCTSKRLFFIRKHEGLNVVTLMVVSRERKKINFLHKKLIEFFPQKTFPFTQTREKKERERERG